VVLEELKSLLATIGITKIFLLLLIGNFLIHTLSLRRGRETRHKHDQGVNLTKKGVN
jgi:hypothetical protein